jgi:formate-dependent nitrite reductase membrane component NrfD
MKRQDHPRSYYGLPVIHRAHWKWLIVFYFFLGGIAGGAQVIGGVAAARNRDENRSIVRAARYVSFLAFLPCPALLIVDLGRLERFLHMLRIVKFRSPMSIGSWTLTLFGAAATGVAGSQAVADFPAAVPRSIRNLAASVSGPTAVAGAALGALLSSYTGALLAATAVPLWAKRHLLLGPIFVSSAMGTAAAAIDLALACARDRDQAADDRVGLLEGICSASEIGLLAAWVAALGPIRKPLAARPIAPVFRHLVVGAGLTAPLAIRSLQPLAPAPIRRPLELVAALLTLAGGLALRYVVIVAGAASADDPEATFAMTARQAHGGRA